MEIAVQAFSGYKSTDNNHVYDLVVSLRVIKTVTDARTPDVIVIAGVTHMLERALVLDGLTLLGHPSACAFEVVVAHVGGLIEATRDENQEKLEIYERKCGELQTSIDSLVAVNAGFGKRVRDLDEELGALTRKYNASASTNDTLRGEITVLKREFEATTGSLRTAQANVRSLRDENETLHGEIAQLTTVAHK